MQGHRLRKGTTQPTSTDEDGSSTPPDGGPPDTRRDIHIDALVLNMQTLLKATDGLLSGVSATGLGQVLAAANIILDQVAITRANKQDKRDLRESINALVQLLESTIRKTSTEWTTLDANLRRSAPKDSREEAEVDKQVQELVRVLQRIQGSIKHITHKSALSYFWHAKSDAGIIIGIRRQFDQAQMNFAVQGVAAIQKLLKNTLDRQKRKELEEQLLRLHRAEASHNCFVTREKSYLKQGTRVQILHDLIAWAEDRNPSHRIYVIHGPAGIGKSSIAYALCKHSFQDATLGASFFFIRDTVDDGSRLFPSLAFQLAHSSSDLFNSIAEAVRSHLNGGEIQVLENQLRDLLEGPLQLLTQTLNVPIVMVVDGIDECLPLDTIPQMLELLHRLSRAVPFIRILIATRPESYIMDALKDPSYSSAVYLRDLGQEPNVDNDIHFYVHEELTRLATTKAGFTLLQERPDAVEHLTTLSDGLFIYARMIVLYLSQAPFMAIDNYDSLRQSQDSVISPPIHERLDMLYSTILRTAFGMLGKPGAPGTGMDKVRGVLTWIALARSKSSSKALTPLDLRIVGISLGMTQDVLDRLRSVLIVSGDITPTTEIRVFHASFPQFLTNVDRCKDYAFFINPQLGHASIASSLLDILVRDYNHSTHGDEDNIMEMQVYAGLNCEYHLRRARYTTELGESLRRFAEKRLNDQSQYEGECRSSYTGPDIIDACKRIRSWYQTNRHENDVTDELDAILDQRVKEATEEATVR